MDAIKTEVVVVGAGPGGYAAAFYAADLGKKVILIEREARLGGVCLNRGCIPSKALLYATHQIINARESAHRGITFTEPKVELEKLREWKEGILTKLSGGVATLAKMRGVTVMQGRGYFEGSNKLRVETDKGQQFIEFDKAIIAVGSLAAMPKAFDLGNPRVMTSTEALEVPDVPENLLIVGGGYIGMELGFVYSALGSKIVMVEAMDAILAGADADLSRPVVANAKKHFKEIRVKAKVVKMATVGKQIKVAMEFDGKKVEELYDRVLVAVGRVPNSKNLGLENTKATLDERGFVKVNSQQQTDDPNIYAI
ncbi:MAG TPA: NAD(P)/FAD-dependent oxidoreductase, partial [Candidatus Baltobacteraceae bacterium]|nr:NAD(P)/FAD-dependent oxidoreductase [Candidatus Baltobacteraceae bacterium]